MGCSASQKKVPPSPQPSENREPHKHEPHEHQLDAVIPSTKNPVALIVQQGSSGRKKKMRPEGTSSLLLEQRGRVRRFQEDTNLEKFTSMLWRDQADYLWESFSMAEELSREEAKLMCKILAEMLLNSTMLKLKAQNPGRSEKVIEKIVRKEKSHLLAYTSKSGGKMPPPIVGKMMKVFSKSREDPLPKARVDLAWKKCCQLFPELNRSMHRFDKIS